MKARLENLEKLPKPLFIAFALLAVCAIALAGYHTEWQFRFSFLFLVPILTVSWFVGAASGVLISFLSVLAWLVAMLESGHTFASDAILYWNGLLLLSFFLVFGLLVASLRRVHDREKSLARTDALTGVANRRAFFELVGLEIQRAARYERAVTVAYFDLDEFKAVNDRGGHAEGDRILCLFADTIRRNLRSTDMVARLGGDEFCIVLPEIGPDAATAALKKLEVQLTAVLVQGESPLTFSVGAITFLKAPESAEVMLRQADELMYSIKASGKDRFQLRVHDT